MYDYPPEEHEVRVICGDPKALAYEWIKAYALNLSDPVDDEDGYGSVTAEELIETAMSNVNARPGAWGNFLSKGGLFEGTGVEPMFWDKLAILFDIDIPESKRDNFFSCSC